MEIYNRLQIYTCVSENLKVIVKFIKIPPIDDLIRRWP